MPHRKLTRIFFAGTDTEVGKTYVASLCAAWLTQQGKRVGVYKPVASGCQLNDDVDPHGTRIAEDAVSLWEAAGRPRTLDDVCPQKFLAPLAPPEAAAAEGASVDVEWLSLGASVWEQDSNVLIVEGAGGLFSPLADGVLNVDLVERLDANLVIVAANRLGVIHQVVSTCRAARQHGIEVAGIFLSQPASTEDASVAGNARQISKYLDVPILGEIPYRGTLDHAKGIDQLID